VVARVRVPRVQVFVEFGKALWSIVQGEIVITCPSSKSVTSKHQNSKSVVVAKTGGAIYRNASGHTVLMAHPSSSEPESLHVSPTCLTFR
jgi:hypothetical protein